jgi:hypothetical protein
MLSTKSLKLANFRYPHSAATTGVTTTTAKIAAD